MFRVLIKVHQVHIRLREELDVQVVLKKGQQNFIIPHKGKLKNGVAIMNSHSQFFLNKSEPVFDIFIMIMHGSVKKFAGMCEVNLLDWQENSNNLTTSLLQKSPDSMATIEFDFMYMSCDLKNAAKNLISKTQMESEEKTNFIRNIQQKSALLAYENERLIQQVVALKRQNKQLSTNQQEMKKQYFKSSSDFENIIKEKQEQIKISANNLDMMKTRMSKIQQIINSYGELNLKQKIGNLLNQQNQ